MTALANASPGSEFATLAGLHLLAVASPGPDFALVLRQSIVFGRATAIATSAGIGAGILVHVGYTLLGLGLILKSSPTAFGVMKWIGAAYLIWIGLQAVRAAPRSLAVEKGPVQALTPGKAFVTGLITNATNVKATLFFVAVFSVVVSPATPRWMQAAYGLWMAMVTALWFCVVSLFFTQARIRAAFLRFGHWFERAMGVVLIALGVRLALVSG